MGTVFSPLLQFNLIVKAMIERSDNDIQSHSRNVCYGTGGSREIASQGSKCVATLLMLAQFQHKSRKISCQPSMSSERRQIIRSRMTIATLLNSSENS